MALIVQIPPAQAVAADPVAASAAADSVVADSVAADSALLDTVAPDTIWYLMLEAPEAPVLPEHQPPAVDSTGLSWILTALLALFVTVSIRFRNNSKYLGAMFKDAVEVRERGNVFDETVREESFMVMLNVLWCISVGILLYTLVEWGVRVPRVMEMISMSGLPLDAGRVLDPASQPLGMALCSGVTLLWQSMMVGLYAVVGNVFADKLHTRMWLMGYLATTGLSTLIFFPLALLALCYPQDAHLILIVALGGLLMAKLVFVWKGFRIFFKEISSWLLFLYYLCSLEIVPLILLFVSCLAVCSAIL